MPPAKGSVAVFDQRDAALRADKRVGVPRGDLLRPVAREVAEALAIAAGDPELDPDPAVFDADQVVRGVLEAARAEGKPIPEPTYRPVIYQLAS